MVGNVGWGRIVNGFLYATILNMESRQLKLLYKTLDDIRHQNGQEYWFARELFPLLGYVRWENFETALNRAKESCRMSGGEPNNHFRDITKMVKVGLDLEKPITDIKLTRYACYLVAVNGDPRKEEVAFAQAYFITKTREFEVLEQRMIELERIDAREKLKVTEKEFADMAWSRGVDATGLKQIRAFGDMALFGKTTEEMKVQFGIANKQEPLADSLPTVTLKAKDLATAMTNENTRAKNLQGKVPILKEHFNNSKNVREALVKTGIKPETLPAQENIKKIEARHRKEKTALDRQQRKELDAFNKNAKKIPN